MAESAFEFTPGRFGRAVSTPGLRVQSLLPVAFASVIARRGKVAAARSAARQAWGIELPVTGRAACSDQIAFLGLGPDQWLAVAAVAAADDEFEVRLGQTFAESASLFDQSGGRILLELSGPRVRDVLAKGFAIDLHPTAFGPGQVASTLVSHLNVQLWQVSGEPRYRVIVVRTWFSSFWRWLAASAAEYGGEVLAPRAYSSAGAVETT